MAVIRKPEASPRPGKAPSALLELRNVMMSFRGMTVISDLNLSVGRDELVSVIGMSGCGKTTLLNLIAGFIEPGGWPHRAVGSADPPARRGQGDGLSG